MMTLSKKVSIFLLFVFAVALGYVLVVDSREALSPAPSGYTLNDIYNLIHNNIVVEEGSHGLQPEVGSDATSTHSLSEIYIELANLVQRENLQTGITYLGITGDYDNPDPDRVILTGEGSSLTPITGVDNSNGYTIDDIYNLITSNILIAPDEHSVVPASLDFSYDNDLADVYEALVYLGTSKAANVKSGVTYLGQAGAYEFVPEEGGVPVSCNNQDTTVDGTCGLWTADADTTIPTFTVFTTDPMDKAACIVWCTNQRNSGASGDHCNSQAEAGQPFSCGLTNDSYLHNCGGLSGDPSPLSCM